MNSARYKKKYNLCIPIRNNNIIPTGLGATRAIKKI